MKTIKNIIVLVFVGLLFLSCNKNEEVIELVETKSVFAGKLAFEKIKDIPENQFEDQMPGFKTNTSNNSLYLSCRDKFKPITETVYKLNVIDLNLTTGNFIVSDFATKRIHIYNDKLFVFGGEKFNKYDLNLNEEIVGTHYGSFVTNKSFSRFGSCILNENAYIVGGFLGGETTSDINYDKKIWKHNLNLNTFVLVANMPKNRYGGSSEIVNNKIYSFFGYEQIQDGNTNGTIQMHNDLIIYDISTNSFQTIELTKNVRISFTAKYENYIFVAGNKTAGAASTLINGSFFGYYNTTTNTMTEIPVTVSDNSYSFPYFCEIEIMNGKIYALVKNSFNSFSIQVANLN
ncbi:hypothetical protein ACNQGB_16265 [Flavobacterium sp. XS1P32]|uniref:hypothetical protein n=1 Tax=unclassified Flavobacterium TaxID=196869 RepID=UPI003AAD75D7